MRLHVVARLQTRGQYLGTTITSRSREQKKKKKKKKETGPTDIPIATVEYPRRNKGGRFQAEGLKTPPQAAPAATVATKRQRTTEINNKEATYRRVHFAVGAELPIVVVLGSIIDVLSEEGGGSDARGQTKTRTDTIHNNHKKGIQCR